MMGKLNDRPQGIFYMLDLNTAELSVRKAAATDALSSADLLTSLSHDPDYEVRRAVAGNPSTPTEVLLNLGKEFPDEIVANPIFNILLLEDSESRFVRLSLARSSTISETALVRLSNIVDEEILCAIAQNPVTPLSILETLVHHPPQLYEDPEWSDYDRIFASVAKNPNVSVELLTELVERGGNVCYAIAENPKTPSKFLEQFAHWRNYDMHQALLQNPNTPASVLEILAGESHPKIETRVKAHPNASETAIKIVDFVNGRPGTPIEILEKLASDHRVEVRRLVVEHPNTPLSALEKLTQDQEKIIRLLVAHHPSLSSEALEILTSRLVPEYLEWLKYRSASDSSWEFTFIRILKHPNVTSKTLDCLALLTDHNEAESRVLDALTQCKKLSEFTLLKLARFFISQPNAISAHAALGEHPNLPAEALEILIQSLLTFWHPNCMDAISYHLVHPNVPLKLLEELAIHNSVSVRAMVARNPSMPIPILQMMVRNSKLDARSAVYLLSAIAENPNTPPKLLLKFTVDSAPGVRQGVTKNINAPVAILETLADDEDARVRAELAKNPSIPDSILKRLAVDPIQDVRNSIIENPQATSDVLDLFANEHDDKIRAKVAQHSNISAEAILKFSEDDNCMVREALLKNQCNLSEEVLNKLAFTTVVQALTIAEFDLSHEENWILKLLAQHPKVPKWLLELLSSNKPLELYERFGEAWFLHLRMAVACNIQTPTSILEIFLNNSDLGKNGVKEIAQKTLRNRLNSVD
jgi:Leucine rich repeat variant